MSSMLAIRDSMSTAGDAHGAGAGREERRRGWSGRRAHWAILF